MAPSCLQISYGSFRAVVCVNSCTVFLSSLPLKKGLQSDTFYNTWESIGKAHIHSFHSTSCLSRARVVNAKSQVLDSGSSQDGFSNKDQPRKKLEVGTRLSRLAASLWSSFIEKLGKARKRAPMKVFSLLLGYYSANALSTLVGQTGDWDVIMVGFAVALMEGISFLAYRLPAFLSKFEEFLSMLNLWKIGLSLGFILDKFKLDSGLFYF